MKTGIKQPYQKSPPLPRMEDLLSPRERPDVNFSHKSLLSLAERGSLLLGPEPGGAWPARREPHPLTREPRARPADASSAAIPPLQCLLAPRRDRKPRHHLVAHHRVWWTRGGPLPFGMD